MTVALETIRSLRAVTPQNTIIEAQHVGQRFTADNGTELTVFDNISFNLHEGEIVAILGRSGAGKSTFLRALAGLVKPTSGTVKYRGKALTGPNPGIARALVLRPDALFMDEPFSALDVLTAENLRQEVLKLWSSEQRSIKSVLMVTHNIEEAVEMADRVVVLGSHPGHLIADVRVDLQRPRDRHSVEFEAMVDRLYAILTGQASQPTQQAEALSPSASLTNASVTDASVTDASDLQPAKTIEKIKEHPLPNATPGGLAGLLDVVAEHPHGIDLADLASALSFEVDDLFPLVDAGTMLRVIVVRDGHVQITEAGDSWHKADILRAKQVFASLAMEHAPLVHNIEHALRKSAEGKLRGELMLDLLRARYANDEAHQQFAIAVEWGRYGELFDYDADDDLLSLDEANKGE